MAEFLLDENLSPRLTKLFQNLGYQASHVRDLSLKGASDEKIVGFAQQENWVVITSDLGFGETFYFRTQGKLSVIILRSRKQSLKFHQQILKRLDQGGVLGEDLDGTLIVATPYSIRRRLWLNQFPPVNK